MEGLDLSSLNLGVFIWTQLYIMTKIVVLHMVVVCGQPYDQNGVAAPSSDILGPLVWPMVMQDNHITNKIGWSVKWGNMTNHWNKGSVWPSYDQI